MKKFVVLIALISAIPSYSQSLQNLALGKEYFNTPLSNPTIDSLKLRLLQAHKADLFQIQFSLFREYLSVNVDSSAIYIEKAYQQATVDNDSLSIANALNGKAKILSTEGRINEAVKTLELALGIAKRNNYKRLVKYLLNNIANSYTRLAAYDKSITYNLESLRIREIEGNPGDISVALNNIGFVYSEMGDYENALIYFNRCYEVKMDNNITYDFELTLVNIGDALVELGKYNEAELKLKQVFELCKATNNCTPYIFVLSTCSMGRSLFKQRKYDEANDYFLKSLNVTPQAEKIGGANVIEVKISNYYWLAELQLKKGNINKALDYLNAGFVIAVKTGLQRKLASIYKLYALIYSVKKDFNKALEYQILFHQINSEILDADVVRKISKIQSEFNQRESSARLESQEKILYLQRESIRQHTFLNFLIGAVTILTIGLALILFRIVLQKQQINKMLNERVKKRTQELENNRDQLKRAHDELSLVLDRISRHLRSSFATLKGLSLIARNDLPQEHLIYFREAEKTVDQMVDYVSQFGLTDIEHSNK